MDKLAALPRKYARGKLAPFLYIGLICLICLLLLQTGAHPLYARIVTVQKDQVNVRQEASTSSAILGKTGKGAVFAWQGISGEWTKIAYTEGRSAYIRNDMLSGFDDLVVTGSLVRIRQSPSLQGAVLGSVQKGGKLTVSDFNNGWYQVQYGKSTGWISGDYVKMGSSVSLTTAPGTNQSSQGGKNGQNDQALVEQPEDFTSVTVSVNLTEGPLSGRIITLDPGHGGHSGDGLLDPGAQSANLGLWEKDVNLDIALKLKPILENMGATVWMTHSGSTGLSLPGRAAVANKNNSHIFISIHTNASENTALNGHSVYFYAPVHDSRLGNQRPLRQALAKYIQDSMIRSVGQADLGVKESNFVVLRETNCPSVLVETAFLSHSEEELLLAQGAFRQKLAEAVASGIMKYFGAL